MLASSVVLYLLITLGIGFWASSRINVTEDYTLAGRSLSPAMVGVTLFATWFGPELIMGVPKLFIENGIQGIITDLFGNSLCLILVGLFFAQKLYSLNITTVSDYFRIRYGPRMELIGSVLCVFTYFSWIAGMFLALGLLFQIVLGTSMVAGLLIGALVVLIYTYVGGMWAVSITDLIQTILIIGGLVFLLAHLIGESKGILYAIELQPKGFFQFLPDNSFGAWTDYLSSWMYFGIGALPAQEVYQRVLSAKSSGGGRKGSFVGAALLFVVGSIPLIIALLTTEVYPELLNNSDTQNLIPLLVSHFDSPLLQILFYGALISAILSTSSGAILAPATVLSENIIKPLYPTLSDKDLLKITRMCVIGVTVISMFIAYSNDSIHSLIVDSIMPYMVFLVVPFVLGMYWKKHTLSSVYLGMLAGGVTWLICSFLNSTVDPMVCGFAANLIVSIFTTVMKKE